MWVVSKLSSEESLEKAPQVAELYLYRALESMSISFMWWLNSLSVL